MNAIVLLVLFFFCGLALIWMALHFGLRWFTRREAKDAHMAASDLEAMFIFTDAERIMVLNVGVLIILPVIAWIISGNFLIVGGCVVLAFLAPRFVLRYISRRRVRMFESQLPDALLMITGALRAGASLPMALESVAAEAKPPLSQEFELVLRELRLGTDFVVALESLERRVPLEDLSMFTAGMKLAREVGANLAETLESISRTLRAKLQMEGKIRSLTAQGKLQGMVMSGLPVFMIIVLSVIEPEAMAPLFSEWYGWVTLAVITVAVSIGYHFINKITSIDV